MYSETTEAVSISDIKQGPQEVSTQNFKWCEANLCVLDSKIL